MNIEQEFKDKIFGWGKDDYGEKQYNDLIGEYNVSARKYFMVLRLAIYHIDGKNLESSYEITQYPKTNEIYKCGVDILNSLYKERT